MPQAPATLEDLQRLLRRSNEIILQYLRTDAPMDMRLSAHEHLQRCLRTMGADEATIMALPHPMDKPAKVFPPFHPDPVDRTNLIEEVGFPP